MTSSKNRPTAGRTAIEVPVQVVLASRSPQRRQLLTRIVRDFEIVDSRVDEVAAERLDAEALALWLAEAKACEGARMRPEAVVIGADTVVECLGEIIGKPGDRADAVRILSKLTRNPHRVVTGLCVVAPDGRRRSGVSVACVRMKPLSQREIERYIDTQDVMERAGAYGLRELDPHVAHLEGSPSAVMGLPLEELAEFLASLYPDRNGEGDDAEWRGRPRG